MIPHIVRAHPSSDRLAPEDQLAWKIADVASRGPGVDADVADMIGNRIIDNAGVAIASINRAPVATARAQAMAHPHPSGACLTGMAAEHRISAEWAAWANGTAVRELDYHDTYLAADYSHPADNIPPLIAVAQQCGRNGADLIRAIAVAYEIHIALVRGICLHAHKIDHIAHLGPSAAAGIGALLSLDRPVVYQAIQQALHCTLTTRQSRKGDISSWKAFAPAHAGKAAIEAVDRAMRGEGAPSPIYEGEDSILACILDGRSAREHGQSPFAPSYEIMLPAPDEPWRAILESYTKEHSAEYQSQALIDLAFAMRGRIADIEAITSILIHTSHHTHYVIGSGSGDPQKMDPGASRETLDHSVMYIFAVALQDGTWDHETSYAPERAQRAETVRLWHKIATCEDREWTERYHAPDPSHRAFGARVVVTMVNGDVLTDELAWANAHPNGERPFARDDYIGKFRRLSAGLAADGESERFLDLVQRLPDLDAGEVRGLNVRVPETKRRDNLSGGIF